MKKFSNKNILLLCLVVLGLNSIQAQNSFYDIQKIQKIEVEFSQPNWDYRLDTAKLGNGGYIMAKSVTINGTKFDSVGVKYKGSSSYDSSYAKNPFHFALDKYINQSYQNITDVKLSNCYADPSLIREALSYQILQNYMECPRANFVQLYINGKYWGLFTNDEDINKDFCNQHFYSSKNTFIKCNPESNPGPTIKSNLKYIQADSTEYAKYYELKSKNGWYEFIALCDSVTNHPQNIESILDMDRAIWMLAFNNVLVNLDSYTGAFAQNYYLYKDKTGKFNPIIWDMNMSFGGFPFVGSSNSSMGSLTVANMQQLPLNIHASDPYWPLINVVMNNSTFKKIYMAHLRTIVEEMFVSGKYETIAKTLQDLVDTAAQSDNNKFYSYGQFQNAMTTNNSVGSYTVPGIKNLMDARVTYLKSTSDYQLQAPTISNVAPISAPVLYASVTIRAQVGNATSVYLAYRMDSTQRFVKIPMYDDGLHNDGAAADGIYGEAFTMSASYAQYYIYATNNEAAMFSPQRAEHEFHRLDVLSGVLSANEANHFELYPNPANEQLTIIYDSKGALNQYHIYNSVGQIILSGKIQYNLMVSTSDFMNGIYFVKVGEAEVKKFVVQH